MELSVGPPAKVGSKITRLDLDYLAKSWLDLAFTPIFFMVTLVPFLRGKSVGLDRDLG